MTRAWLLIWLALLLGQLLLLWLGGALYRLPQPDAPVAETQLLELARLTRDTWGRMAGTAVAPPAPAHDSARDPLLQREEWMLRLRDAEQRMTDAGLDIRIAEPLQAWLQRGAPAQPAELAGYLRGLAGWMDAFAAPSAGVALERAALHPDGSSAFPALSFELSGIPDRMGERVLAHCQGHPGWLLREMDLNATAGESSWWMRGSCVFEGWTGP